VGVGVGVGIWSSWGLKYSAKSNKKNTIYYQFFIKINFYFTKYLPTKTE
jgi:hypothetical protein